MLPLGAASLLILLTWGPAALTYLVLYRYWLNKHMTEARRSELKEEKWSRWEILEDSLFAGLPALFVIDGLFLKVGVLYSPWLSFFNPLDGYIQSLGLAMAALGAVVMVASGRKLAMHVYSKTTGERVLMTSGIYAYVRHPFYLSGILLPLGVLLMSLNILALIPLRFMWFGKKLSYNITTWMEEEEQELLKRFGEEYEEYMKRTGRLLPKIRR